MGISFDDFSKAGAKVCLAKRLFQIISGKKFPVRPICKTAIIRF
jgi:hypothetical protein